MVKRKKHITTEKTVEEKTTQEFTPKAVISDEQPEDTERKVTETTPDKASDTSPDIRDTAAAVEEKLAVLTDRYLRLLAEYDNFRKRTERERSDIIKTASEDLIRELLPILDNLDRATEHRKDKTTYDEYVKGIAIIEDQFRAVLSRVGLERIEAVGKPFDPIIHDAVGIIESNEHESGIVIAEQDKGYILSGKVIRHPKVIVSK